MSCNTYKYTDLRIRKVEACVENWENDGFIERVYFEVVDEDDNVYIEFDDLHELLR